MRVDVDEHRVGAGADVVGVLVPAGAGQHHLVAHLDATRALAHGPDDARGVGAADVERQLGLVLLLAVGDHVDRPAQRGPDVVVVDARGHHPHQHLTRARLRHVDHLGAERVDRLAIAVRPDQAGVHLPGHLAQRRSLAQLVKRLGIGHRCHSLPTVSITRRSCDTSTRTLGSRTMLSWLPGTSNTCSSPACGVQKLSSRT